MMRRVVAAIMLTLIFIRELLGSSVAVLKAAFARNLATDPAIIRVPVTLRSDAAIVALANLITLTPGTTTLHIAEDRKSLYIHCLQASDVPEILNGIHGSFERWLLELEG